MNLDVRRLCQQHSTAFVAMGSRVISALGWLLGMVMVVRYLTPAETGFFYAFQSLVALQVFLEMGMATVIIMSANHEVVNLTWENGRWNGCSTHLERLGSIARVVGKWYGFAGSAVIVLIIPMGIIFFSRQHTVGHHVAWLGPWIALGFTAGASVIFVGFEALAEGIGAVNDLAHSRLWQAFLALVIFVVVLRMGAGLWASPLMVGTRVLVGFAVIARKCGRKLIEILRAPKGDKVDWRKDLFPFQWRIAVSWMSGYAIYQVLTPTVFYFSGPIEAGRFGLAVQIAAGVGTVSGAWLQVRQAYWAQGAARRDWVFLDRDFIRVSLATIGLAFFGCSLGAVILVVGSYLGVANRLPSWGVFIPFALAVCINQYIFAMATYLRSFLVEPFLLQSILMAAAIAGGAFILRNHAPYVLAWWYCVVTATLGLWLGQWIFYRWRKANKALG